MTVLDSLIQMMNVQNSFLMKGILQLIQDLEQVEAVLVMELKVKILEFLNKIVQKTIHYNEQDKDFMQTILLG